MAEKAKRAEYVAKIEEKLEEICDNPSGNILRTSRRQLDLVPLLFEEGIAALGVPFIRVKDSNDAGVDNFANFTVGMERLIESVVRLADGLLLIPGLLVAVPTSFLIGLTSIVVGKPKYIIPMIKGPFEFAWISRGMCALGIAATAITYAVFNFK